MKGRGGSCEVLCGCIVPDHLVQCSYLHAIDALRLHACCLRVSCSYSTQLCGCIVADHSASCVALRVHAVTSKHYVNRFALEYFPQLCALKSLSWTLTHWMQLLECTDVVAWLGPLGCHAVIDSPRFTLVSWLLHRGGGWYSRGTFLEYFYKYSKGTQFWLRTNKSDSGCDPFPRKIAPAVIFWGKLFNDSCCCGFVHARRGTTALSETNRQRCIIWLGNDRFRRQCNAREEIKRRILQITRETRCWCWTL